MKTLRTAIWLALCLAAASCSGVGLVYNHLDTAARLQLGRYVDLAPSQRESFDRAFHHVWAWHRRTQLPRYADDLQALALDAQKPLDTAAIAAISARSREQMQALLREAVPLAAPLLAGLSDAQVNDLLAEIDEQRAKRQRREAKLSDAKWAEKRYDKAVDQLEDWAGTATPAQRERIRRWATEIVPLRHLNGRDAEQRREQFAALLQRRQSPGFGAALQQFLLPSDFDEQQTEDGKAMQQATHALMADLSRIATAEQREHFNKRLTELAAEMRKLSRDQAPQHPADA